MTVIKSRCTAMRSPLMAFEGDFALRRRGDKLDLLGVDRLAFRAVCPTQASSISNYALGLWFHIEAKPRDPGRWLIGHAVDVAKSGIDPCVLRAQGQRRGAATAGAGRRVLARSLEGAGL